MPLFVYTSEMSVSLTPSGYPESPNDFTCVTVPVITSDVDTEVL